MASIRSLEFYVGPTGDRIVQARDGYFVYSRDNYLQRKDFTDQFIRYLDDNYSEAYDALRDWFRSSRDNLPYFRYCIVDQFIACNCCGQDSRMDIDNDGILHVEPIYCPIRNRCPRNRVVCFPKPNTLLSKMEFKVMKLYYEGMREEDIAEELSISAATVLKHKANVFKRYDIHDLASFIRYAKDNNVFDY